MMRWRSFAWPTWLVASGAIGAVGCNAILGLDPSTLRLDAQPANDAEVADAGDDRVNPGPASDGDAANDGGRPSMPPPDGGVAEGGCAGACVSGTTRCAEKSVQTCGPQVGGCPGWSTTTTCSAGLVCERAGGAACVDPSWAEWPVPDAPSDVAMGAGNLEKYTDNGDGTVTDGVTQLMWQQVAPTTPYSQTGSIAYCAGLTLAGYDDWRLPSQIELISLVDFGASNPCIDTRYFPNAPTGPFWSSTPSSVSGALAWGITFFYGTVGTNAIALPYGARCVR
jgi:hypothetical protein